MVEPGQLLGGFWTAVLRWTYFIFIVNRVKENVLIQRGNSGMIKKS